MTTFRHTQRKGEPADLYAIRVIADVLPALTDMEASALANWVKSKSFSTIQNRIITTAFAEGLCESDTEGEAAE